jgi:hypothetical protein
MCVTMIILRVTGEAKRCYSRPKERGAQDFRGLQQMRDFQSGSAATLRMKAREFRRLAARAIVELHALADEYERRATDRERSPTPDLPRTEFSSRRAMQ